MAIYVVTEEIKSIARRLKTKFPHNLSDANIERIVFLMELESPSKTKLAVTKKIDSALKTVYTQHDYVMIFFNKRLENLNDAQKNILVLRELMHCTVDGDKLNKFDVEEFYPIAVGFGVNWADNADVKNPLAEDFHEVLTPKPVDEPDKYAKIMDEDYGIESNISSQYKGDDDDTGDE